MEFRATKTDRLDRVLRESGLAGSEWLSRQAWDWLFEHGLIFVNGRKCSKAGTSVSAGDTVLADIPQPLGLQPTGAAPVPVWEAADGSLAVFNKPPLTATLAILPWEQNSFASSVAAYAETRLAPGAFARLAVAPSLEGGLLQRLDNDTSGLLAAAFTPERKAALRALFSGGGFEKTYLALVTNAPPEGEKRLWLSGAGAKVKVAFTPPIGDGEPSAIHVRVRKKGAEGALVEVRTRQGGRHIVRAGLAALGAPLLGDVLYGGSSSAPFHQLHAAGLRLLEASAFVGFPALECPAPESFLDYARRLGLH